MYGNKVENVHLAVDAIEFEKVLRKAGESTVIELIMPDGSMTNVLIHDVQNHYLNSQPIHVDFFAVNMKQKLQATVQIEFVGEAPAVKVLGGTLVKMLNEVNVECLPQDLPPHFEIDISALKTFDDMVTVKDIPVSDLVEILAEAEDAIAKVQAPRNVEEELAPIEDAAAVEAAAVAAVAGEDAAGDSTEGADGDKGDKKE
jgi:large subunit ribosomal protein L25